MHVQRLRHAVVFKIKKSAMWLTFGIVRSEALDYRTHQGAFKQGSHIVRLVLNKFEQAV